MTTGTLREHMVDALEAAGAVRDPAVTAALRTVPRHVFLPGVPPATVYTDEAIVTHRDAQGRPTSSSSQPAIMARMLEQLAIEPGQRVLEIGAGSGYNAALIAHLVGPGGWVDTVDLDSEVSAAARAGLARAGVERVTVHTGDGWLGVPGATFDRVIATVGVWDIAPAWVRQLAPNGLLVAPLWLRAGLQATVAFAVEAGTLVSREVTGCGFMRLRGPHAGPESYLHVDGWGFAREGGTDDDAALLASLLAVSQRQVAPRLPRRWELRLALEEEAALIGFQEHSCRPAAGVLLTDPPGLALVAEDDLLLAGCGDALERLQPYLEQQAPIDLERLRIRAVPLDHTAPTSPWALERPHHRFLLDHP